MFELTRSLSQRAAHCALCLTLSHASWADPAALPNEPSRTTDAELAPPSTVTAPSSEATAPNTAPPRNIADALFRAGREALQRGNYELACAQLAESDRIEPSPGAKLNRALCEEQRGHTALVWRLLQATINSLPADDERALIAQRHAEDLQSRLAFLTITLLPGVPATARIATDGVDLARTELGIALPFDPGEHRIDLSAHGYAPRSTSLTLRAGERRQVEVALGAPLALVATKPKAEEAAARSDPWRTAGWGLAGAAGALALSGGIAGTVAYRAKNDMENECDAHGECSVRGVRAAARGQTSATISSICFAGAILSGGVSTILLLTSGRRQPARSTLTASGLRWEF